ncbi:hypothetical protein N483_16655 [Pseudoalteromonas luteoviolacea NCIMB 1944]|uniref:Uncharacterized protein n=1 Tax=Pseudoalteromonas luteoviolacea (strain 2ta16) TaxID=1353533 RepID=V4J955_PSEL2|nr:hypothetical protein PL2TA16_05403 [Pseudoalteromonas luteoviolacea 2ta16]KZN40759.1 hypothetical protein N483_16655 [Pseudoalteromonas luteoviolacea NCIMB 1944]
MDILYKLPTDLNHIINISIWLFLILAVVISKKSPTVRWIALCILIARTIDIVIYPWALTTGTWFYVIVSMQDLLLALVILFRYKITYTIANKNLWSISKLAKHCHCDFRLTSNEIMYVLILFSSILVNIASLIERGIRKLTDYNPMFIYNSFESMKWLLTLLSVMVIFSLTIDAVRGLYTGKKIRNYT